MLERATFETTTGTGPPWPPAPPPRRPPPAPPVTGAGWLARHTAYPATPATISRNSTQMSPRFLGFRELGGADSGCTGAVLWSTSGTVLYSGSLVLIGIRKRLK